MNTTPCPRCATILEVALGEQTACGVCGHEFTPDLPEADTHERTETVPTSQIPKVSHGKSALIGCVACWMVGVAFLAHSLGWFFVFLPLFLAAFVLAIVAIAQRRVLVGIVMLLVTLIGSPLVGVLRYVILQGNSGAASGGVTGAKAAVEIVEWSVTPGKEDSIGSIRAEWKIHLRNNSQTPQVGGVWLYGYDKNGFQCYENVHEVVTVIPPGGEFKVISRAFFSRGEYDRIQKFGMIWK